MTLKQIIKDQLEWHAVGNRDGVLRENIATSIIEAMMSDPEFIELARQLEADCEEA